MAENKKNTQGVNNGKASIKDKAKENEKSTAKAVAKTSSKMVENTASEVTKNARKTENIKPENVVADKSKKAEQGEDSVNKKRESKRAAKVENGENKKVKKVLFATSEAGPFIRTGGLGDVAQALPKALSKEGIDCRVILPLYREIPNELRQTMKYVGSVYVTLAWRYQYCGVFMMRYENVTYYLLDNEYYFKRNGIYGHYDDAERFAFFSKAILEVLNLIDFYPDVLHCNDWQTALAPVFLDCFYRHIEGYGNIKTVFTIHNIEFQGKYGVGLIRDVLGLPEGTFSLVEYAGAVNFMKGGIESSNAVTTVSESYSEEIKDKYFSYGLDAILRHRKFKLSGIVNGIDTILYDPLKDKALFKNYTLASLKDKAENKKGLLKMLDLPYNCAVPVIGMVTRLTEQKGINLVTEACEKILEGDVQIVILGKGDWKYESMLGELQSKYPSKLRVMINFSQDIASKIYGGADIFLMPSKFEPCGLSQMIAMRYGTVPVVREVGGLKDTVTAFNSATGEGKGFTFGEYSEDKMIEAITNALECFKDKELWGKVVANGMNSDFSWANSAKRYIEIYNKIQQNLL